MNLITQDCVDNYYKKDTILSVLNEISSASDEQFKSQQWLRDSIPKRYIFEKIYQDLFDKRGLKIIDVGGGITAFSKILSKQHDYTLIEIMNHDKKKLIHNYDLKLLE